MKKFFVSIVLFSVCNYALPAAGREKQYALRSELPGSEDPVTGTATKNNIYVSTRIQASFKKEFEGASIIKWERVKGNNLYLAHFIYKTERIDAYFDEDGQLIATGRFIQWQSLPVPVKSRIARAYVSYNITQVIELTQNNETSYLLTLENERRKMELHTYVGGAETIVSNQKKSDRSL